MWQESARLWEASLGIVGMLGLLIGFGIAASFALNNAKRKQDGESAVRLKSVANLSSEIQIVGGAGASSNNTTFDVRQREVGPQVLQAAAKGQ